MAQTLEQLRSRVWPTFEKALHALHRAGFPPEGEDYRLGEVSGQWSIVARDDDTAGPMPPPKEPRLSGESAKQLAKELATAVKSKRAKKPEAAPAPAAAEETPPANENGAIPAPDNIEPLPSGTGPWFVRVADLPQFKFMETALRISRDLDLPVQITTGAGRVLREVDGRGMKRTRRGQGSSTRARTPRAPSGELPDMAVKCVALAKRGAGAKRTELTALTKDKVALNWKQLLARWGARENLTLRTERVDGTPVYWLS